MKCQRNAEVEKLKSFRESTQTALPIFLLRPVSVRVHQGSCTAAWGGIGSGLPHNCRNGTRAQQHRAQQHRAQHCCSVAQRLGTAHQPLHPLIESNTQKAQLLSYNKAPWKPTHSTAKINTAAAEQHTEPAIRFAKGTEPEELHIGRTPGTLPLKSRLKLKYNKIKALIKIAGTEWNTRFSSSNLSYPASAQGLPAMWAQMKHRMCTATEQLCWTAQVCQRWISL